MVYSTVRQEYQPAVGKIKRAKGIAISLSSVFFLVSHLVFFKWWILISRLLHRIIIFILHNNLNFIFQLFLMMLAVFGVTIYRVSVSFAIIRSYNEQIIQKNYRLIASVTGAMISATFIIIFKMVFSLMVIKESKIQGKTFQSIQINNREITEFQKKLI